MISVMRRVALLLSLYAPCALAQLKAGAAKRPVTPDLARHAPVYMAGFDHNRKATGVHDDLYARCLALATGARPLVVCAVDVIGLFRDDVEKIRARVGNAGLIVASLHDHEGPDTMGMWGPSPAQTGINEAYTSYLIDQTVAAAKEAIANLRPARVRLAKVRTPELDTFIDDTRPPVVHDPEIVVLRAETADGKPIATLVNWANHPETLGSKNTLITADYSGYLCKEIERLSGGDAVFVNGAVGGMQSPLGSTVKDASGNIVPEKTFEKAEYIGTRVAKLAADAVAKAGVTPVDNITWRETTVRIPMTNPGFQMAAKAGVFAGRKNPNPDGTTTTPVGYLRLSASGKPQLEVALIPGEMYPELSVGGVERFSGADFPDAPIEPAIKPMLTAPFRMLFGLANDEIGYIIPKAEWDEKAPWLNGAAKSWYGEVNSVGPDAAAIIADAFKKLTQAQP
jgi:hypothetical protein